MNELNLSKPFASGATAEIYDLGDGRLFKRFHDDKPNGSIENEYGCTLAVQGLGLGAPKLYERVDDERGRGFIMEKIEGVSLFDLILQKQGRAEELIRQWTRLQVKMNSLPGTGLPTPFEVLPWRLQTSPNLTDKEKRTMLKLLDSLPRGDRLCHIDYHPMNVLMTATGMRIIDWCDTMSASPWMDVARTRLVFAYRCNCITNLTLEHSNEIRAAIDKFYYDEYTSLCGENREELDKWMAVIAAIKVNDVPEDYITIRKYMDVYL